MIYILSWTTKKHQKILSRLLHSKLKKIQALLKDLHRNLRTFQGKMEFKDFSRTSPKIQGLFKTVRTLPKQRLAEERKKNQRSLQAFLSYAAHRSLGSFRVPRARDYSRYSHMETSTALAGYEELVGGLTVPKLKIMYPIFTLSVQNCSNTLQVCSHLSRCIK